MAGRRAVRSQLTAAASLARRDGEPRCRGPGQLAHRRAAGSSRLARSPNPKKQRWQCQLDFIVLCSNIKRYDDVESQNRNSILADIAPSFCAELSSFDQPFPQYIPSADAAHKSHPNLYQTLGGSSNMM